jgi:hypothetical protein
MQSGLLQAAHTERSGGMARVRPASSSGRKTAGRRVYLNKGGIEYSIGPLLEYLCYLSIIYFGLSARVSPINFQIKYKFMQYCKLPFETADIISLIGVYWNAFYE